jgi:adenosylcobinamide-phosphate synthase
VIHWVLLAAIALDLAFGEPPDRVHPVAWLGRALGAGRRRWCRGSRPTLLLRGAGVTLAVAALAGLGGGLLHALAARLGAAGLALEAVALALLLSVRGLVAAARRVAAHLRRGDLVAARESVGRDLVSRRTDELDPGRVASAAAESVAENLTDAFVGPACFYLAFGLAGAAVYRAVNTADAMFGYREGPLEYFGKVAARLDDALNFLPARLAGWAIVLAAGLAGESARGALAVMRRDRGLTASPNAGWTMAAMAGALGVTLEKPGAYRLGAGPLPDAAAIDRANKVLALAVAVSSTGLVAGAGLLARLGA